MNIHIYAKLNLCLKITGKAADGRHNLDGIFMPVPISDELAGEKSATNEVVYADGRVYERDVAKRALNAMTQAYGIGGTFVKITKGIPEGAGLGGSSADAGGVIRLVKGLYDLSEPDFELMNGIGSDVPYFYCGGAARVTGVGQIVRPVTLPKIYSVVLVPNSGVDTGRCYRLYDEVGGDDGDVDEFLRELQKGNLPTPFNALTRAAEIINPQVGHGLEILRKAGFVCGMTGSGSATFGMENDPKAYTYKLKELEKNIRGFTVYTEKE